MPVPVIVFIVVLAIFAVIVLARSIVTVHQAKKAIVERFGRYKETLDPGLRFLMPFVDRIRATVDLRETVIDIEPQQVITNDNVAVTVDAVV